MEPLWDASASRGSYRDARLAIDYSKRAVTLDSQSIALTAKEYLLLSFLAAHNGETFTRTDLLLAVWGYSGQIRTRTLDVHLARLRRRPQIRPVVQSNLVVITKWLQVRA